MINNFIDKIKKTKIEQINLLFFKKHATSGFQYYFRL